MASNIPAIIKFAYDDYKKTDDTRIAACQICQAIVKDKQSTTSNFIRHLKQKHPAR